MMCGIQVEVIVGKDAADRQGRLRLPCGRPTASEEVAQVGVQSTIWSPLCFFICK
jgi:hypothetical protein